MNEDSEVLEYSPDTAVMIAFMMAELNAKTSVEEYDFVVQYILQKGLKIFGERGMEASKKEIGQLYKRTCFTPINVSKMTTSEKKKAVEALLFLCEKRDGKIKGRMVYNGKPTRKWLSRDETASPTVALESTFLTGIIDAKEGRDVMTNDVPNAFIQAEIPELEEGKDRIIMKITGVLVDLLVEIAPDVYGGHIVYKRGTKVIYVQVLRALYGMLKAALLWYKKFRSDLEGIGFRFNPYDPCVADRMRNRRQHTI